MKFKQLSVGAEFLLGETRYVKATPILAKEKGSGVKKLIRQSVDITPVDDETQAGTKNKVNMVNLFTVRSAFDQFYSECEGIVKLIAKRGDGGSAVKAKKTLSEARQRFFRSINKK